MLDTPLGGQDMEQILVPARDNHVRYPFAWPGYAEFALPLETSSHSSLGRPPKRHPLSRATHHWDMCSDSAFRPPVRFLIIRRWARRHVGYPPWAAWTRKNTWFQFGTTFRYLPRWPGHMTAMLNSPHGWPGHLKTH
eukprot:4562183-Pyramimonas_sp.AAC.1